jgi:hypothetical protein
MLQPVVTVADDVVTELSIVMPCLYEAQTVGVCIKKHLHISRYTTFEER